MTSNAIDNTFRWQDEIIDSRDDTKYNFQVIRNIAPTRHLIT